MLDDIGECVRRFLPVHRGHGELECRLGALEDGRFSSGVPRDTFEQLERDMSEVLVSDRLWNEHVDYFYLNSDGQTIRTRVTFDNRDMKMQTQHVRKEVLRSVLIARDDDLSDACRLTCAVEHPVDTPPVSVVINYVRVKQRKRFVDVRDGNEVWVFELSKTWAAGSRDAVEYQQHNVEPRYEVECELVDATGDYLASRTPAEVTESLLMKMKVLLGEDVDGHVSLVAASDRGRRKRPRKSSECEATESERRRS